MARSQVLPINSHSDGDGRVPQSEKHFRDDAYYLGRLGEMWSKDLGLPQAQGVIYTIDRLPAGYSGWGSRREGLTHIDRYLFGHRNGHFRSMNEAWPHFKYLMDHSNTPAVACSCPKCVPKSAAKRPRSSITGASDSLSIASSNLKKSQYVPATSHPTKSGLLRQDLISSTDEAPSVRGKQSDEDGVNDVYRALLDKLQTESPRFVDEPLNESLSPDSHAGREVLARLLRKWQEQPPFIPRVGEIVLFVRDMRSDECIRWDTAVKKFKVFNTNSDTWAERTLWVSGVVTQEPTEECTKQDLLSTAATKKTNINQSGFRVEPLSNPKRHCYIPLHAIRPLALWQDCVMDKDRHPTITEALTTTKSFCLVEKFHFKGSWPRATVFAKALFLGPELIMGGDLVRFLGEGDFVDIMRITSIKLVFINLDEAGNDDWDGRRPYNTVLHVSGHVYSLEPTRSFDHIGKVPANVEQLPLDMPPGKWFHVTDPASPNMRVEIPYSRLISRYSGPSATSAWYGEAEPPSAFQPVNAPAKSAAEANISRGVAGILSAREHAASQPSLRNRSTGGSWFWADTRVEQLSLKEVNDRLVGAGMVTIDVSASSPEDGPKEKTREEMMPKWRASLKLLFGSGRVDMEKWRSAEGAEDKAHRSATAASGSGLVASGLKAVENSADVTETCGLEVDHVQENGTESSSDSSKRSHSEMDVDNDARVKAAEKKQRSPHVLQRGIETIEIDDSD